MIRNIGGVEIFCQWQLRSYGEKRRKDR